MLGAALLVGTLLHASMPISVVSGQRALIRLVGGALIAIGAALSAWVVQTFRAAPTPVSPGRPTTRLVHIGPYRYSRNPDYLGQILVYVGATLVANTWWPLFLLPLVLIAIQRGVVRREERYLEAKFGREYRDYMDRVHRWLCCASMTANRVRTTGAARRNKMKGAIALSTVSLTVIVGIGALVGVGESLDTEASRLFSVTELGWGMNVAEIGAGKGELSLLAARRVGPSGHVWSTEIDGARVKEIRRRAEKEGFKNVTVLEGSESDTNLPSQCCDVLFLRGVYHHFTRPVELDASMLRALRPGGRLAVIDFAPRWYLAPWKPRGVPANRGGHGIPSQVLIDELQGAGFLTARVIEDWPGRMYCVVVRKPE